MTKRQDICNNLIHFTKGNGINNAFENLCSIVLGKAIIGSNRFIKNKQYCICFTEAPINSIPDGLENFNNYSQYYPFGIMVSKKWLFSIGGRPVIYQTDDEYNDLPALHKWKHVRYDPLSIPPIDFTWEREWRIQTKKLDLLPEKSSIVVPNIGWAELIKTRYETNQELEIIQLSDILGEDIAEMYRENFSWIICTLDNSG